MRISASLGLRSPFFLNNLSMPRARPHVPSDSITGDDDYNSGNLICTSISACCDSTHMKIAPYTCFSIDDMSSGDTLNAQQQEESRCRASSSGLQGTYEIHAASTRLRDVVPNSAMAKEQARQTARSCLSAHLAAYQAMTEVSMASVCACSQHCVLLKSSIVC